MSKTYYLEMCSPADLVPRLSTYNLEVVFRIADAAFSHEMYQRVGEKWEWNDRKTWTISQWEEYHMQGRTLTYAGLLDGEVIGYLELDNSIPHEVEILYFGLLPGWIGRGLGGSFLTKCIERAWQLDGVQRVWLHTCTNDHAHALENYKARGFTLYQTRKGCH